MADVLPPPPRRPYPLIQLPEGSWVRADQVTEIKCLERSEDYPDMGDRVVVFTAGNGCYLHPCDSFAEARRLRDATAIRVAVAIDAVTGPTVAANAEAFKERPDFFLT